jgi:uncharacterized phage protein (TIGR01671 family)
MWRMKTRTLKFRVWDKVAKRMYIWPIDLTFYLNNDGKTDGDFVLQQFTGLRDKNRKEIYEGDVVSAYMWDFVDRKSNMLVAWDNGFFGKDNEKDESKYVLTSDENSKITIEVIGNIYEYPHLLKEMR